MLLPCFRSTLTQSPESIVPLPHVRESETVLDSGFHAVDSGFQEQISALSVERGFRISVLRRIPDSKAHWLRFRIQQAKTSWILESGFPYVGRVVVLQPCFRSNWTRCLAWMWLDRIWSLKTRLSFSDHGTKSRSLESHCYRHRHDDPYSMGLLYK